MAVDFEFEYKGKVYHASARMHKMGDLPYYAASFPKGSVYKFMLNGASIEPKNLPIDLGHVMANAIERTAFRLGGEKGKWALLEAE